MVSKKIWIILNIALGLFAVLLVLNFAGVKLPTLGKALYAIDTAQPACVIHNFEGEYVQFSPDRCCLEVLKVGESCRPISFTHEGVDLNWECSTANQISYLFNDKGYQHCKINPIWQ